MNQKIKSLFWNLSFLQYATLQRKLLNKLNTIVAPAPVLEIYTNDKMGEEPLSKRLAEKKYGNSLFIHKINPPERVTRQIIRDFTWFNNFCIIFLPTLLFSSHSFFSSLTSLFSSLSFHIIQLLLNATNIFYYIFYLIIFFKFSRVIGLNISSLQIITCNRMVT